MRHHHPLLHQLIAGALSAALLAGCGALPYLPGMARTVASDPPTHSDLPYADASPAQKLDLYLPTSAASPFPLVIFIHGGSFLAGDKAHPGGLAGADQFLAAGYAVASINYRFSSEALYPAQIQDAKAAVRTLRRYAETYRLDPARFAVIGDSAGGTLAALLGTTCGVAELEGDLPGTDTRSSCVQAVVDWYGPIDFLSMDKQSETAGCPGRQDPATSPTSLLMGAAIQSVPEKVAWTNAMNFITPDDAAFLIQHGSSDCNVPPAQSQAFAAALEGTLGAEKVSLEMLPGGHGGEVFWNPGNIQRVILFLDQVLKFGEPPPND